jgi:hypothetical protein
MTGGYRQKPAGWLDDTEFCTQVSAGLTAKFVPFFGHDVYIVFPTPLGVFDHGAHQLAIFMAHMISYENEPGIFGQLYHFFTQTQYGSIWRFPKIGDPQNHGFED